MLELYSFVKNGSYFFAEWGLLVLNPRIPMLWIWIQSPVLFTLEQTTCWVTSVVSHSLWPHGLYIACQTPLSILHTRMLERVAMPSSTGSNPHLLCLLHWQAGSLLLALPGKSQNATLFSLICTDIFSSSFLNAQLTKPSVHVCQFPRYKYSHDGR